MLKNSEALRLQRFLDYLNRLVRDCFNNNGRSLSFIGMSSSASVLGDQLRKAAASFAELYLVGPDVPELTLAAKKVEGYIMTARTISVITQEEADNLIDELYKLCENR